MNHIFRISFNPQNSKLVGNPPSTLLGLCDHKIFDKGSQQCDLKIKTHLGNNLHWVKRKTLEMKFRKQKFEQNKT